MVNETMNLEGQATPLEAQRCATCGAGRNGTYCSRCGQKEFTGPHTMRGMLRGVLQRTLDVDEGVAHTAYGLTVRPREVIRDFWAGRTVRYTHPVPYFMLAVGLFALTARLLTGPTGAAESDRLFAIFVVPFAAAASRLLGWWTRRNFAEHLIAILYLSGHTLVLATGLYIGIPLVGSGLLAGYGAMGLALLLGYFVWAYSQVFSDRLWIGALTGLAALTGGTAAWAAAMLALLNVLRS